MHMAQNAFARCAEKVNTRKNLTLNRQAVGEVVSYCTMIAANDTLDFNRDKQERLCTEMNHRAEVYTVEMSAYGQPKAREKLRERTAPILKVFLMAFPEWLACIFMVVGLVVTALAAVRLGYGLVVAKTVYKWIVNAEEKFGSGAGAEKKAHVIAVLRGYTPDWLDWAINERTLDWIMQLVFDFTKKKLEDYMAKKSAETTTVAHFGNVGENKRND